MLPIQIGLPWGRLVSKPRATKPPRVVVVAGREWPLVIARHRGARRYVLRLTPRGELRLTVPRGASIEGGVQFVRGQAEWITRERLRRERVDVEWTLGSVVWWRGERLPIASADDGRSLLTIGDLIVEADGATSCKAVVSAAMRAMAARELPLRCLELAAVHGHRVTRVSIRNQRSRWGSCSARGTIALNWRLIQMPPFVSDYVMLHELSHLRHANHSRAFWREVASVCAEWREAEAWIRRYGKELI